MDTTRFVRIDSYEGAAHRLHEFRAYGKNGIEYRYGIYCTREQAQDIAVQFLRGLNLCMLKEITRDGD